ncbi:ATPase [Paenibacillus sp. YN15]|uniref:ATPase n=1 Tax=Paenibacillus sp. YN15 TaxID=1742774 RepID=UPI000DCB9D8B|nr:ATPase [Paenibacillus sp. YN15]RAU95069.1 ATPase [Paenibacillus sp. YN15]
MLQLGQKVFIVADSFEQNLPIGEHGYIIAYDRNADNVFEYVVRVPKVNKHFFVTGSDIETEELLLSQEAEWNLREALIDFALATRNEALFHRLMNGESEENPSQDGNKDVVSREDFIRQVGLKAWI